MHRIVDMEEAYQIRVAKLSHLINAKLIQKRDSLINKTSLIDQKVDLIKSKQEKIERDIRTESGLIIERLKTAESKLLQSLKHLL